MGVDAREELRDVSCETVPMPNRLKQLNFVEFSYRRNTDRSTNFGAQLRNADAELASRQLAFNGLPVIADAIGKKILRSRIWYTNWSSIVSDSCY